MSSMGSVSPQAKSNEHHPIARDDGSIFCSGLSRVSEEYAECDRFWTRIQWGIRGVSYSLDVERK